MATLARQKDKIPCDEWAIKKAQYCKHALAMYKRMMTMTPKYNSTALASLFIPSSHLKQTRGS